MPPRFRTLSEVCPRPEQPDAPAVRERDLFWAEGQYRYRKLGALRLVNRHHWEVAQTVAHEASDTGFVEPSIFYESIEDYRRFELRQRALALWPRFWDLRATHQYYRVVMTTKQVPCRQAHADRLESFRRFVWNRLGPLVTGHVRSLHVHQGGYLHWDYVIAVSDANDKAFAEFREDTRKQIYGKNGQRDVSIWYQRIARNPNHLHRSINYSLKCPRFFPAKAHAWVKESIQSDAYGSRLGLARRRWTGFKKLADANASGSDDSAPAQTKRGRPPKSAGPSYRRRTTIRHGPAN